MIFNPSHLPSFWSLAKSVTTSAYNSAGSAYNSAKDGVSSLCGRVAANVSSINLGSIYSNHVPRVAIGDKDVLHALESRPQETVMEKCFQSLSIYQGTPLEEGSSVETKKATDLEKSTFTQRLFAFYAARTLCEVVCNFQFEHPENAVEYYETVANVVSAEDNKDFWTVFKEGYKDLSTGEHKEGIWNQLTLIQKVKAVAVYYLFGDIAKNFIEDFANNIMTFLRDRFSKKEGIEGLFIDSLQIYNRFFGAYRQTAKTFVDGDPRNVSSNFEALLDQKLTNGDFIKAMQAQEAGSNSMTPMELYTEITDFMLDKFLPKLRIKDAMWKKLQWDPKSLKEFIINFIPYIFNVIFVIPLLLISYIVERYANSSLRCSIKSALLSKRPEDPRKITSSLERYLISIPDLSEKGWDKDRKQGFDNFISDQLKYLMNNNSGPISKAHLNPIIRKAVKELIPSFLQGSELNRNGSDPKKMSDILNSRSEGENRIKRYLRSNYVQGSIENTTEDGLLVLLAYLTKSEDAAENLLQSIIKSLSDKYTKKQANVFNVSEQQLRQQLHEITNPSIVQSIQHVNGSRPSTGSREVQRFFDTYREVFANHLEKIREHFESKVNNHMISPEAIAETLHHLHVHRSKMMSEYQQFMDIFKDYNMACNEIEKKLGSIADEQTKAFQLLVDLSKDRETFNNLEKQKTQLEKLREKENDPGDFSLILSKNQEQFNEDFEKHHAFFRSENNKRLKYNDQIVVNNNAVHFLSNYINSNKKENLINSFIHRATSYSRSRNSSDLTAMHRIRTQIVTSMPADFTSKAQSLIQNVITCSSTHPEELTRNIRKLQQGFRDLQKDIEDNTSKLRNDNNTSTQLIKNRLHISLTHASQLIRTNQSKMSQGIANILDKLTNMTQITQSLTADKVVPLNFTTLASGAGGTALALGGIAALGVSAPLALPAAIGAATGYIDPANRVGHDLLKNTVSSMVDEATDSAIQFIGDKHIYRGIAQAGLLIALKQLRK